jgi:hypothetical protein
LMIPEQNLRIRMQSEPMGQEPEILEYGPFSGRC